MDSHQHDLTSIRPTTSTPEVAHNTPASAPVNCAESLSVPPLGVGSALSWLTAESALGRVREATLVRASLISGEPCKPEALIWLRELTTQRVLKALWAAQVLRTLHDRGLA